MATLDIDPNAIREGILAALDAGSKNGDIPHNSLKSAVLQADKKAIEKTLRKAFGDSVCDELLLAHRSRAQLRAIADRFCPDLDKAHQSARIKRIGIYQKYRRHIPLVLILLFSGALVRQLYLRNSPQGGRA